MGIKEKLMAEIPDEFKGVIEYMDMSEMAEHEGDMCVAGVLEDIAEEEALVEVPLLLPLPSKVCCFILAICTAPKAAVAAVCIAPRIKEAGAGNAIEEVHAPIIPANIVIVA